MRNSWLTLTLVCTIVAGGVVSNLTGHDTEPTRGPVITEPDGSPPPSSSSSDPLDMRFCIDDGVPYAEGPCQWLDGEHRVITEWEDGQTLAHAYPDGTVIRIDAETGETWLHSPNGEPPLLILPEDDHHTTT